MIDWTDFRRMYFGKHVEFGLMEAKGELAQAAFLASERKRWEEIEDGLAKWTAKGGNSPNPFMPPFEPIEVAKIIRGLNRRMGAVVRQLNRTRLRTTGT